MWVDEIVEEIHRIRDEYAKSFDYDMDAIFADLRKKEAESDRKVVNLSKKKPMVVRGSKQLKELGESMKSTP